MARLRTGTRQKSRLVRIVNTTDSSTCVIGLAFGYREDNAGNRLPGEANARIAQYVASRYNSYPLLMQQEIADALSELGIQCDLSICGKHARYLDSRQVLLQSRSYMRQHGFSKAIVVAQAHHIPRIRLLCKKLGIAVSIPDDLPAAWDKESGQLWTRSYVTWIVREPLVLAHHKLHKWI